MRLISLILYADGITAESIAAHFANIDLTDAVLKARGDKAALIGEKASERYV
ncbi:MAG: hypothetical protein MZV63_01650 [Marinilabiliales bacterium]|nr:hypothetical protein [Marinilabiliales bacterium]